MAATAFGVMQLFLIQQSCSEKFSPTLADTQHNLLPVVPNTESYLLGFLAVLLPPEALLACLFPSQTGMFIFFLAVL